jgi:hypothetical protein
VPDALTDVLTAVRYCARGGERPSSTAAFELAKRNGLLAQDPVWRATERGMGALVGAGLLAGEPAPVFARLHVLWAASDRYPPQFVAAWPDGLVEAMPEEYEDRRREAEEWYAGFGDEPLTFWTTLEELPLPSGAPVAIGGDRG